jgi:hypothetical protein
MKIAKLKPLSAALGLAAFLATSSTHAQDVIFGSAQTITGDANLIDAADTAGAINVDAILPGSVASSSLTANGVMFNLSSFSTTSASDGTITLTANATTPAFSPDHFTTYGNNALFSGGSSAFNAVMNAGGLYGSAGTISISAAALTAGDTYDIQIFNYSGDSANESTTFTSGGSSVTLFDDNGSHVGQFVTGTFTATGSSETISFGQPTGSYTPVVGAINLVEVTAVPEPSTFALLGAMLLLVPGLRMLRQQAR